MRIETETTRIESNRKEDFNMPNYCENYLAALVLLEQGFFDITSFLQAYESGELELHGKFVEKLHVFVETATDLKCVKERIREVQNAVSPNEYSISTLPYNCKSGDNASEDVSADSMCRYQALSFHAHGGMGQIWVARDLELQRNVALKELMPEKAYMPNDRNQFASEARLVGQLEHPAIIPVYGFGVNNGGYLSYAMRFVSGKTLSDAIRDFHALKLDPSVRAVHFLKLLKSFTDVCNAVEYAHARGIVHRDIKPTNIVLGEYGEAYLIDWGLATQYLGQKSETSQWPHPVEMNAESNESPMFIAGTPMYMSPEQASGRSVRPASDIYSLGATLYELLTGHAPFAPLSEDPIHSDLNIHDLLERVKIGDFVKPQDRRIEVDSTLQGICVKAMSLVPENRFSTVREMVSAIEQFQTELPLRHWKRAVRHFESLHLAEPEEVEFLISLARSQHNLGVAYWGQQRFEESTFQLEASQSNFEKVHAIGANDVSRELAAVSISLAQVCAQTLQKSAALEHYEVAQSWLALYLRRRNRDARPELVLQMIEPSDVGFMRFVV